ncbi:multidrug effflux MFS transporter [Candidatus Symbiopectobacterium sp. NZEC135]|uniref:multidrug effflux MFS transporter n=1 Tax=Candidatus Symbiopectobacterium sp. NZEC135 TaxID=2820471 RepID=UPI002225BD2A|nr:multidrug effflux MFS transporter [Candidatus Symbiopectobacterium sp. NZEC135]MCW2481718.1 multidrug effflux MFS transporter [Candidatus Symbiopectobacterium sp. NZEC135]
MSESLRPGAHRFTLIAILGILCAFDAMSIDLYLPAFPAIAHAIGADAAGMQTSLSVFLIGLAFGQVLYGPFTDRYGRKVPLLLGIALFLAASVCLSHSASLTEFVFFRLLQGIGGAAGLVIPRAIVADLYAEREAAKVFSLLMQVMAIAPIVAPPLGNLLSGSLGWQSIFWGLGLVGAIMLFATWRWVPESLPRDRRMQGNIGSAFVGYSALFRQRVYMGYTLSGAFTLGGLFTYIGASAFIFIDYFHLSPTLYSTLFAANALGMVVCGQINIFLLNRWREQQILAVGLGIHLVGTLLLVGLWLSGGATLWLLTALLFMTMSSLSLVFGNGVAVAMGSAVGQTGVASSLLGVMQYLFGGVVGVLLGVLHNGTLLPPLLMLAVCALAALLCWHDAHRQQSGKLAALSSTASDMSH